MGSFAFTLPALFSTWTIFTAPAAPKTGPGAAGPQGPTTLSPARVNRSAWVVVLVTVLRGWAPISLGHDTSSIQIVVSDARGSPVAQGIGALFRGPAVAGTEVWPLASGVSLRPWHLSDSHDELVPVGWGTDGKPERPAIFVISLLDVGGASSSDAPSQRSFLATLSSGRC
jgi:hypothetical protein